MVPWDRNLELVFDLVIVEEELEGRCLSVSVRQARLGRDHCALAQDGGFYGRMRPRALQKTCKDSAVEVSGGGGTVDASPRWTQKVPGEGDIVGNPNSRRGVPSLSEPRDFEPLWRKDHGQPY